MVYSRGMIPSRLPVIGVENGATEKRFAPPSPRGFSRCFGMMV